jgi:predicted HTH domain antitoxin
MTIENAVKNIETRLKTFPLPTKPSTFGKEYTFPEDVSNLASQDLGKWLFKLGGWKGYTISTLAREGSEYSVLEQCFNAKIAMKMNKAVSADKKLVKEALIGKIIDEDEELKSLKSKLIEKKGSVTMLEHIIDLYSMQLDVVSREITRRSIEIKSIQKGLMSSEEM